MRRYGLRTLRLGVFLLIAATAPALAQTITVSPTTASVPLGGDRILVAYADGAVTSAVTWAVNGIIGGNSSVGTIDVTGKYVAPTGAAAGLIVTATATSKTNPASSASCVVQLRNPVPMLSSLSPNPLPLGAFLLTVNGSRFVSGAQVLWNGTPMPTSYQSASQLVASGNATAAGSVSITVANPGPGSVSAPLSLPVGAKGSPTPSLVPTATATPTIKIAVAIAPATITLQPSTAQQFQATVAGSANQAVTWKVNNTVGGDGSVGTITASGLYTAPATVPIAGLVTISAVCAADGVTQGTAIVTIKDPFAVTYGRFLEQATFGPTSQLTAHLAQVGIPGFIDEQFATAESPWPPVSTATRSDAVDAFFGNAMNGQDQLRQRVIFALSEIIVIAMNKNTNGEDLVPWLQLLSRNAFGNYRTLLKEITLDASMGKYLDLANSGVAGGAPNENYPREVMQLFSIGLYQLNLDGSVKVDAQNNPLNTYTQTDVQQLAKALTGWTYGNSTGIAKASGNFSYYPGPMLPIAAKHNTQAKTILGQSLPANQTIQKDLDDAIGILFNHPNVGPFIATRLIRALITSNPSPAYIARTAAVFNDNGSGVRGDMKAVIRAILLDAEARNDNPPANFGRLRTPMQNLIALSRALGYHMNGASGFAYLFYDMHEGILDAPSVFGHYSPTYRIPKTTLFGPEFQIYSPSDAVNRANFFYSMFYNPWPINPILQPFVALAGTPSVLADACDNALLYGRMSPGTRAALLTAIPAMPDNNARVLAALYLTSTSGEYLIQR